MNLEDFYQLNYNVLATNSQLEGTFHFKGETIINAKIKGTIIMSDFSKLIIERNAEIEGNIYGKDILVLGSVNGLIDSAGNVFFQST
jgi:cytoskeletal protein CcmA (bactofilin family)